MRAHDKHCRQQWPVVGLAKKYERVLRHGYAPRRPYQERMPNEYRSIRHQGQRKLLMSEIELLTLASDRSPLLVVYAGAAQGIHIPLLADMFPWCTFHLYDPASFARVLHGRRGVRLFNRLFTDEDARGYACGEEEGRRIVFISDIRTGIDEARVWMDMQSQRRWVELVRPAWSSLKFRLPWGWHPGQSVEYLEGDIYLPVWGRTSTTECRLVVDGSKGGAVALYWPRLHEEEMSHFNRVVRPSVHLHTIRDAGGLDRCYDCASEIWILRQYLRAFHTCSKLAVASMSENITAAFHGGHLQISPIQFTSDEAWGGSNRRQLLSMFWESMPMQVFQEFLLEQVNTSNPSAPHCRCLGCTPKNQHWDPADVRCRFKRWFAAQAEAMGMTMSEASTERGDALVTGHECAPGSFVFDVHAHFTTLQFDDVSPIRYGARLWKATTANCPELAKLRALVAGLAAPWGGWRGQKKEGPFSAGDEGGCGMEWSEESVSACERERQRDDDQRAFNGQTRGDTGGDGAAAHSAVQVGKSE